MFFVKLKLDGISRQSSTGALTSEMIPLLAGLISRSSLDMKNHRIEKRFWRLAGIGAFAVALFWLWQFFASEEIIERAVVYLQETEEKNRFLAQGFFFMLALLSAMLAPFSSAPLIPVGIFFWGSWLTFFLLVFGWVVGESAAYAIGRYIGYPIVARIISQEKAEFWLEYVSRNMTFLFAFLFRTIMPAETGYLFGLVHYSFSKYLAITASVEVVFAAMIVWASGALLENDFLQFIGWIAAFLVIAAAGMNAMRVSVNHARDKKLRLPAEAQKP